MSFPNKEKGINSKQNTFTSVKKTFKNELINRKYQITVFSLFILFSIVYSLISYLRYLAFTENVFDLGVNAQLAYSVLRGHNIIFQIIHGTISTNKLIYIPIGLLYGIFPKEYMLLFIQDFFLSLSGVVVYYISCLLLNSKKIGLTISVLWFLFFPLMGIYWFDFHYMAFFPTFFLIGIYYYYKGAKNKWLLAFVLAAITDLMAPLLVLLFIFLEIGKKSRSKGNLDASLYEVLLVILAILIFILPTIYVKHFTPLNYIEVSYSGSIYGNIWFKAEFFLRILWPFLFIPLIGFEYLLLLIPYGFLLFANSYWPYESQLHFQYPSLYIPTLFLALIIGLKRIHIKYPKSTKRLIKTILLVNLVLFVLFTPIGNLVHIEERRTTTNEYITGSTTNVYSIYPKTRVTAEDNYLRSYMNSIPKGSSVLVQGNFPEIFQGYNPVCLNSNFNTSTPSYILTDPYSYFFNSPVATGLPLNDTPILKINYLINNYNYTLLNYYKGVSLYKLGSKPENSTKVMLSANYSNFKVLSNNKSYTYISFLAPGIYTFNILGATNYSITLKNNSYISYELISSNYIKVKITGFLQNQVLFIKGNASSFPFSMDIKMNQISNL